MRFESVYSVDYRVVHSVSLLSCSICCSIIQSNITLVGLWLIDMLWQLMQMEQERTETQVTSSLASDLPIS